MPHEERILEQLVSRGIGTSGLARRAIQQEGLPTLRQALGTVQATRAQQQVGRRAEFRGRVSEQRGRVRQQLASQLGTTDGAPQIFLRPFRTPSDVTQAGEFTFVAKGPGEAALGGRRPTNLEELVKLIRDRLGNVPIGVTGIGGGGAFRGIRGRITSAGAQVLSPGFQIPGQQRGRGLRARIGRGVRPRSPSLREQRLQRQQEESTLNEAIREARRERETQSLGRPRGIFGLGV